MRVKVRLTRVETITRVHEGEYDTQDPAPGSAASEASMQAWAVHALAPMLPPGAWTQTGRSFDASAMVTLIMEVT